jgi:hypothetical protein
MEQGQVSAYRGSGFRKFRGQGTGALCVETPEVMKRDVLLEWVCEIVDKYCL